MHSTHKSLLAIISAAALTLPCYGDTDSQNTNQEDQLPLPVRRLQANTAFVRGPTSGNLDPKVAPRKHAISLVEPDPSKNFTILKVEPDHRQSFTILKTEPDHRKRLTIKWLK